MFYIVSKLFWQLAQPGIFCLTLIAGGLILGRWRRGTGLWLAATGLFALAIISLSPLPRVLIYPLEQQFASVAKPKPGDQFAGIILLGGFEEDVISRERGGLEVNESGERMLETLLLARRLPDAKIIFAGGSQNTSEHGGSSAVARYLADSGIASERVVIEPNSRTTQENAQFLKQMLHPKPDERFVLVTSAFHMPRAVGVFRAAGFDVVPDQVDYRTPLSSGEFWEPYSIPADGLRTADHALKEWVGLVAYRLSGRTRELWPAP